MNKKYALRRYQEKVVDAIGKENAIVKMPTGSGKTFVAAEFIKRGLQEQKSSIRDGSAKASYSMPSDRSGNGLAALFLVPACDLVAQQRKAINAWIGDAYEFADYMGGKASPTKGFDVLVSTPQAFLVSKVHFSFW